MQTANVFGTGLPGRSPGEERQEPHKSGSAEGAIGRETGDWKKGHERTRAVEALGRFALDGLDLTDVAGRAGLEQRDVGREAHFVDMTTSVWRRRAVSTNRGLEYKPK